MKPREDQAMEPIKVKMTAEGWRVWVLADLRSTVYFGDRIRPVGKRGPSEDRRVVALPIRPSCPELYTVVDSPGLPCEVEGLEWDPGGRQAPCVLCGQRVEELPGPVHQAREALEDARDALECLMAACGESQEPIYRREGESRWLLRDLADQLTKALEGIS